MDSTSKKQRVSQIRAYASGMLERGNEKSLYSNAFNKSSDPVHPHSKYVIIVLTFCIQELGAQKVNMHLDSH